jgi:hypothetical protein
MESDRMGFRINNEKEDAIMAKDPVCGMDVRQSILFLLDQLQNHL